MADLGAPLVNLSVRGSGSLSSSQRSGGGADSDRLITVPRCGPVNFSHTLLWAQLDFDELKNLPEPTRLKIIRIMRRYLWPINILRICIRVLLAVFSLIFIFVWGTWLGDISSQTGPNCQEEKTLRHFKDGLKIARIVCFSIAAVMQLCLVLYFQSARRMQKLEARLNAVTIEPGASELNLVFRRVPFRSVHQVFTCTFFVKKSQRELKRAYRNKVDLFELTLEDEECPIPDSRPSKSCEECLLEDVAECMSDKVKRFAESVGHAKRSAEDMLTQHTELIDRCKLDFDMVLAITMYTFDLEMLGNYEEKDNFYYNLNNMYRDVQGNFWESCNGYLFYLLEGLRRLDAYKLPDDKFLYRGVDKKCARHVRNRYKQGMRIVWAAFSSAAAEDDIAAQFAENGGIVFRIRLLEEHSNARDISELSMYKEEQEVLLLPNFTCRVDKGPHFVDLVEYVDLVEVSHESVLM